jgi:hypothetical protein
MGLARPAASPATNHKHCDNDSVTLGWNETPKLSFSKVKHEAASVFHSNAQWFKVVETTV